MIPRAATSKLLDLADNFPIVAITGPRRSGKSTISRAAFPDKPCISLEAPDIRESASSSPADFLRRYPEGAIVDDAHRSPELLNHLLQLTDADHLRGRFILTGPLPMDFLCAIDRPQEARFGLLRLLPLSVSELTEGAILPDRIDDLLYRGMYPALYDQAPSPSDWFSGYVSSYLDRDVRQTVNIRDQSLFQRFLSSCASRTGQILNFSIIARECGISHNTARAWLSILESGNLVFFLQPHLKSFGKRLVKTPKLYFCDTGLAAWLMGIRDGSQLSTHPMRGALFENWVIVELIKGRCNRCLPVDFHFWRDNIGNEIDLVVTQGETLLPIEISSDQSVSEGLFDGLRKWLSLAGNESGRGRLVYAGAERLRRNEAVVIPWMELDTLAERL